jgi:hypothetical protein
VGDVDHPTLVADGPPARLRLRLVHRLEEVATPRDFVLVGQEDLVDRRRVARVDELVARIAEALGHLGLRPEASQVLDVVPRAGDELVEAGGSPVQHHFREHVALLVAVRGPGVAEGALDVRAAAGGADEAGDPVAGCREVVRAAEALGGLGKGDDLDRVLDAPDRLEELEDVRRPSDRLGRGQLRHHDGVEPGVDDRLEVSLEEAGIRRVEPGRDEAIVLAEGLEGVGQRGAGPRLLVDRDRVLEVEDVAVGRVLGRRSDPLGAVRRHVQQ